MGKIPVNNFLGGRRPLPQVEVQCLVAYHTIALWEVPPGTYPSGNCKAPGLQAIASPRSVFSASAAVKRVNVACNQY